MAPLKSLLVGALATLAVASPVPAPAPEAGQLQTRQFMDSNDLTSGSCKDVTLVFARGSTELGNMVSSVLPLRSCSSSLLRTLQRIPRS